ncbi:MAG: hypothetical protein ACKVU0_01520 [Saprospiraceae bacterium]
MKKSVFFFALLISLGYGCYKVNDLQIPATQSQSAIDNPADVNTSNEPAGDRGPDVDCCIQLVVSSTLFDRVEICGVANSLDSCTPFTNNCGTSSGFLETIVGKDGVFCVPPDQPFSITNIGGDQITIYLATPFGNTAAVNLAANGGTISYATDCNGVPVVCN